MEKADILEMTVNYLKLAQKKDRRTQGKFKELVSLQWTSCRKKFINTDNLLSCEKKNIFHKF